MTIRHLLIIDIDGLRPDVFFPALTAGKLPHMAPLLGNPQMSRGVRMPILAPAPSITFCSQASLFTGAHPNQHGIPGNQFFDRFGEQTRFYAFDMGDTLEVDDAVKVYANGLAGARLQVPTLYEMMGAQGKTAVVAGNMYARGAEKWLKPSLINLARFIKGGNLFGMAPEMYDRHVLDRLVAHLSEHGLPPITTMYFLGLDHTSHKKGPRAQEAYLRQQIDPMVGALWTAVLDTGVSPDSVLIALVSDHGQIGMPADDAHSLRMAFPFEPELNQFFESLGLDVHDYPGEAPNCDAVMALNGGLAHVYLHNQEARWMDVPKFERDVLPVAKAFWEAHATGAHAPDLEGAVGGVLLRNVMADGWYGRYHALTPQGEIVSLAEWFGCQPAGLYADPVHRLNNLAGPYDGDLIVLSNQADGFYFGKPMRGVHGGLHPAESHATLAFGAPGIDEAAWLGLKRLITKAIYDRCQVEGGRHPTTADLVTGLTAVTRAEW